MAEMIRSTAERWQAWNQGGDLLYPNPDLKNPDVYRARIAALKALALKQAYVDKDANAAIATNAEVDRLHQQFGLTDYELFGIGLAYQKLVGSYAIHAGDITKVGNDVHSWIPEPPVVDDSIFPIYRPEEVLGYVAEELYHEFIFGIDASSKRLHQDAIDWLHTQQAIAGETGNIELADMYASQLGILVRE